MELQDENQALMDRLAGMGPPQKIVGRTTVRARCMTLMPFIRARLDDGHSYKKICQVLSDDGLIVSATTLAQYVFQARKSAKTTSSSAFPNSVSANEPVPTVQLPPPPMRPDAETEAADTRISAPRPPGAAANLQSNNATQALLAKLGKPRLAGSTSIQRQPPKASSLSNT